MRPWLLRPPFLGSGRTRDFSGVVRVISAKSATDEPRRPGVVGLYLRIAMFSQSYSARSGDRTSEDVDAVAGGQADDGALGVLALADAARRTTRLALAVERVDRGDLDVEHLLDRDLDLGLVRVGPDDERVLVVVEQAVALLAHDRRDQHVAVVLVQGAHSPSSSAWVCSMDSAEPASTKPAASASSADLNQNSASVASYHCPPGAWYLPESALPLIS